MGNIRWSSMLLLSLLAGVSATSDIMAESMSPRLRRVFNTAVGDTIRRVGVMALSRSGGVEYIYDTYENIDAMLLRGDIRCVARPRRMLPTMDFSRAQINVDKVLPGKNHASDIIPYTGKGVVIGVVDGGIDPHHVTFLNRERTESRVKRYMLTESSEESETGELVLRRFLTPGEIAAAPSDNKCDGHGTHTASIAAGAWTGNEYYGVAPDAELVLVSMGDSLYDDEIIAGMNEVVDYATSHAMPYTMNFSIGNTVGPHDGSGIFSLAAKNAADKGAVIAVSSGNDGSKRISLCRDFSVDPTPVSTALYKYHGSDGADIDLVVNSEDDTDVEIAFLVVTNPYPGELLYMSDYLSLADVDAAGGIATILDTENPSSSLMPRLADYFSGRIELEMGNYDTTGRFYAYVKANFPEWRIAEDSRLGISIRSPKGANVRCFTDGYNIFGSAGIEGFLSGSSKESISDMAVGDGVIAVGSTNTARTEFTGLSGTTFLLSDFKVGEPNDYTLTSSYGTSFDDRHEVLPQVLAPGSFIMAAYNGAVDTMDDYRLCSEEYEGATYYWGQYTGTSMSSPAVAGVVALWLEANPNLTRDDVVDVIANTSGRGDIIDRYGDVVRYGEIDAYAGLKYILANMGVDPVVYDAAPRLMVRWLGERSIECVVGDVGADGRALLISMDGCVSHLKYVAGNVFTLDIPDAPGIYILRIPTSKGVVSQKIIVR